MKYLIESPNKFLRNRWFINDKFGIAVRYWINNGASVILDSNGIAESYVLEEIEDLRSEIEGLTDSDNDRICIDYPCPWYLEDYAQSTIWNIPKIPEELDENFSITIMGNYVFDYAAELEKAKNRNYWSTMDDDFEWIKEHLQPSCQQNLEFHQHLAKVWNSGSWKSIEALEHFLKNEFGMLIEDDECYFYSPTLVLLD